MSVDGVEQRALPPGQAGLFLAQGRSVAEVTNINSGIFTAAHRWSGLEHHRSFELSPNGLAIKDQVQTTRSWTINYIVSQDVTVTADPKQGKVGLARGSLSLSLLVDPKQALISIDSVPVSPSYGRVESAARVILTPLSDACTTTLEINQTI